MKGYGCVYKGVEVKRVNGNAKRFFVCVGDEKFWNIKPNETNSSLKTLNNNVIKIVLKHWTKGNKESLLLNLFLSLMWLKGISILFIDCATWQILMLSRIMSLLSYIYIYIYIYWYWLIDWWLMMWHFLVKEIQKLIYMSETH